MPRENKYTLLCLRCILQTRTFCEIKNELWRHRVVTCFEVKESAFCPEGIYTIYIFTLTTIVTLNIVYFVRLASEVFSKFACACSTECCPLLCFHLVDYNLYFVLVITIYVVTVHKVQRSVAFSLCRQISILKRHSAIALRPLKFPAMKFLKITLLK